MTLNSLSYLYLITLIRVAWVTKGRSKRKWGLNTCIKQCLTSPMHSTVRSEVRALLVRLISFCALSTEFLPGFFPLPRKQHLLWSEGFFSQCCDLVRFQHHLRGFNRNTKGTSADFQIYVLNSCSSILVASIYMKPLVKLTLNQTAST